MVLRPLTITDFMAGMWLSDAYTERSYGYMSLLLPNLPGARQDRLNPDGDTLFTAKSVAKEINMRGFYRTVVLDPHSDVAPALIDNCKVVKSYEVKQIVSVLKAHNYDCVISPDAGAEKRATGMAKALGVPLYHAWKTRDVSNGNINGFGIQSDCPTEGKSLIVDDICDGGGTFLGLKGVLPPKLSCDLFVTHGIFSKGVSPLLGAFNTVFCTDSTAMAYQDGANVIEVCEHLVNGDCHV
jgi:ribose-phosphate pyrophosphokinase